MLRNTSAAFLAMLEWHREFSVPISATPVTLTPARAKLRVELIREEYLEYRDAMEAGDIVAAADALGDLLYVTYGAAVESGIPLDAVFAEIHRSNMTKVWPDGSVRLRDDGKILKPNTYSPADVKGILERYAKGEL